MVQKPTEDEVQLKAAEGKPGVSFSNEVERILQSLGSLQSGGTSRRGELSDISSGTTKSQEMETTLSNVGSIDVVAGTFLATREQLPQTEVKDLSKDMADIFKPPFFNPNHSTQQMNESVLSLRSSLDEQLNSIDRLLNKTKSSLLETPTQPPTLRAEEEEQEQEQEETRSESSQQYSVEKVEGVADNDSLEEEQQSATGSLGATSDHKDGCGTDDEIESIDGITASIRNLLSTKDSTGVESDTIISTSARSNLSTDDGEDGTQFEAPARTATGDVLSKPALLQDIEQQLASLTLLASTVTDQDLDTLGAQENIHLGTETHTTTMPFVSSTEDGNPELSPSIEHPTVNAEVGSTSSTPSQSNDEAIIASDPQNADNASSAATTESNPQSTPTSSSHFTEQLEGLSDQEGAEAVEDTEYIEKRTDDSSTSTSGIAADSAASLPSPLQEV